MRSITAEVEISLDEFEDEDLIDELEVRGYEVFKLYNNSVKPHEAVSFLANQGCPADLLDEVRRWIYQPVVDQKALEAWCQACATVA